MVPMARKVLIFLPHNPFPPRTGAHKRFLEIAGGFAELGCSITLAGSTLISETAWATFPQERPRWASHVVLHDATWLESLFLHTGRLANRLVTRTNSLRRSKGNILENQLALKALCPGSLRRRFDQLIQEQQPDIVLINYALWDNLLNHDRYAATTRIVDAIDLVSVNSQMRHALSAHFPPKRIESRDVPDYVLAEDYFERLQLTVSPAEFHIYDHYDATLTISKREADLISANTSQTRVQFVPMTAEVPHLTNTYDGPAVYCAGYNPFNIQGYFYFVKKVLPRVKAKAPTSVFELIGAACNYVSAADGISLAGYIEDLRVVYTKARFAICPLIGGTGQQVKIVDAMAHGLPVVALRAPAEQSPLRHRVNGLVAENSEQFAEFVVELWTDQNLCRQLGQSARETVASQCSPALVARQLSDLLQS
jgi:glycosyltransferase involved in cell wall biosynthesis